MGLGVVGCGSRTGPLIPTPCYEVVYGAPQVVVGIEARRQLGPVDVVILLDVSQSAGFYVSGVRRSLRDQVGPAILALPNARMALGSFVDFPESPCGRWDDYPFRRDTELTESLEEMQRGIDGLRLYSGGDTDSASNVEALFQLATGAGAEPWVRASPPCESGRGAFCLRDEALPLVLHFGDSPFNNGPGGSVPYADICPPVAPMAASYDEAIEALQAARARVISFHPSGVSSEAIQDLRMLAQDTGAVGPSGEPLVFDLGVDSVNTASALVSALATFSESTPVNLDAIAVDPDPDDGFDPRTLIERIEAIEARPAAGVEAIDREVGVFTGVRASTRVVFGLVLRNDIPPGARTERHVVEVQVRVDGRAVIDSQRVEIVVPGLDGRSCDSD